MQSVNALNEIEIPLLMQEVLKYLSPSDIANLSRLKKSYNSRLKSNMNHLKKIHQVVSRYPFLSAITRKYNPITSDTETTNQSLERLLQICHPENLQFSTEVKIKIIEKELGIDIDVIIQEGLAQQQLWNNNQIKTLNAVLLFYLVELYGKVFQESQSANILNAFIKGFFYLVYLSDRFNPKIKSVLKIYLITLVESIESKTNKTENFRTLIQLLKTYKNHVAYETNYATNILQQFFVELDYSEYAKDATSFFKKIFIFDEQIRDFCFAEELNKIIQFVNNLKLYLDKFGYSNLISLPQSKLNILFRNSEFTQYLIANNLTLDSLKTNGKTLELFCSNVGTKLIQKLKEATGSAKLAEELKSGKSKARNLIENLNKLSESQAHALTQNISFLESLNFSLADSKFFDKEGLTEKYLENFQDITFSPQDIEQFYQFEMDHPEYNFYFSRCPKLIILTLNNKDKLIKLLNSIQHSPNKLNMHIVMQILNEMANDKDNLVINDFYHIKHLLELHNKGWLAKLNARNCQLLTTEILRLANKSSSKVCDLANDKQAIFSILLPCSNPNFLINQFGLAFLAKDRALSNDLVKFLNWNPDFAAYILQQCNQHDLLKLKKIKFFSKLIQLEEKFIQYLHKNSVTIDDFLSNESFYNFLYQFHFMRDLVTKLGLDIAKDIWRTNIFKTIDFTLISNKQFLVTQFLVDVVVNCFTQGEFKLKKLHELIENGFLNKSLILISRNYELDYQILDKLFNSPKNPLDSLISTKDATVHQMLAQATEKDQISQTKLLDLLDNSNKLVNKLSPVFA